AFQRQDATTPGEADTSAFAANQWSARSIATNSSRTENGVPLRPSPHTPGLCQSRLHRSKRSSDAERALLMTLPKKQVATLLIDNYFDKIHWCFLIFFQDEFKERFENLFTSISRDDGIKGASISFVSLVLGVCLTSLPYLSDEKRSELVCLAVDSASLQEQILSILRLKLLDYVSSGSIEAVQTCILLGCFHLYHGEPELAWPICGCGLRIAQALNLHRAAADQRSGVPDFDDPVTRAIETKRRCWWSIYETETICSMLYGFPLSIVDEDCDVELPDPYPLRSKDPSWKSNEWKAAGKATLLSFKRAMAELTIIVKSALSRLYGTQRRLREKDQMDNASGSDLQLLISTIAELDGRLKTWRDHLPVELLLGGAISKSQTESLVGGIPESLRSSFPSQTKRLQLFGVQSLSLKLAFENARILVHRPLLSYKTMAIAGHSRNALPLRSAVRACRDAALQIAQVGSTSEFNEVAGTYAVSFVALHLFTAGVALSILTSLEPLSRESFESKMGLRQLISMHSQLKAKSIVAEQGFEILKRLMTLVMSKETERMLQFEGPADTQHGCSSDSTQRTSDSIEVATQSNSATRAGESLPSTDFQGTSQDDLMDDSRPDIPEDPAQMARSDLGFCEDPLVTQALLDFEQAMSYDPNGVLGGGLAEFGDPFVESCFGAHDQGWIWNPRN
ncbi:hypothetical protein GCG54_00007112, partial [Colletotrichum gloeosporioides]